MAMAGPVLSMTPGSPNVSSVSARARAKSAGGSSLKTSGGVPPGGATSSPRAAPTKYRCVWSMWFSSVRTSQPSQVVGSSSRHVAPPTLVDVQSLARPLRSSRSRSMIPSSSSLAAIPKCGQFMSWRGPIMGPISGERVAIRAVMFDFGGVVTTSPFEAFARLEVERGLPEGFIRTVNAPNPDEHPWARLERNEIGLDAFAAAWASEARALGHELDGRLVLEKLSGDIRPKMVAAIDACRKSYETACLTNNFASPDRVVSEEVAEVYALFDAVLESRVLGVRKPDPRFYELACATLGVQPEESVFLDDLGVNLKPARALGMHTIKVTDPDEALAELEKLLGHPVVND